MKFRVVIRDEAGRPDIRDISADSPEEAEAVMALEGLTVSEIHPLDDSVAPASAITKPRPEFRQVSPVDSAPIPAIALPPPPLPTSETRLSGRQNIGLACLSLTLIVTGAYLMSASQTLGRSSSEIFAFGIVALVGGLIIPVGFVFLVLFWFFDARPAAQPSATAVAVIPNPTPQPIRMPDQIASEYFWDQTLAKTNVKVAIGMAIVVAVATLAAFLFLPPDVPRIFLVVPWLLLGPLMIFAIKKARRLLAHRSAVVRLSESDIAYAPDDERAAIIPWDRMVGADVQGGRLTLRYVDYQGKSAKLHVPFGDLRNGFDICTFVGRRLGSEWKETGLFLK